MNKNDALKGHKMLKKLALSLVSFAAISSGVQADAQSPYYGRFDAGIVAPNDISFSSSANSYGYSVSASGDIEFENGMTVTGAIGRQINNFLAAEIELGYSQFDYDKVTGNFTATSGGSSYTVNGSADVDGSIRTFSGLVNAIVSPLGKKRRFDPYIGVGLGLASWNDEINSVGTLQVNGDRSGTDLMANGILGFNYGVTEKIDIGAKYRYVWADTGQNGYDDMSAHTFTAGLTFKF